MPEIWPGERGKDSVGRSREKEEKIKKKKSIFRMDIVPNLGVWFFRGFFLGGGKGGTILFLIQCKWLYLVRKTRVFFNTFILNLITLRLNKNNYEFKLQSKRDCILFADLMIVQKSQKVTNANFDAHGSLVPDPKAIKDNEKSPVYFNKLSIRLLLLCRPDSQAISAARVLYQ